MFDEKTRKANQVNLTTFGNGFAGRGIGLNETISTLRPLVTNAIPVLHNLASPQTGFGQLFVALDRRRQRSGAGGKRKRRTLHQPQHVLHGLGERRPVARTDDRRRAARVAPGDPLASRSRPNSSTRAPISCACLRPSAKILTTVAAPLGHAFEVGAVNLRSATALNGEVAEALEAFAKFGQEPARDRGHRRRHAHARAWQPALRGIGAGADDLQLRDAHVPQPRELALAKHRRRYGRSRDGPVLAPTGRTTRASPPRPTPTAPLSNLRHRVAQALDPTTTICTSTRTPTSPAPASRRSAKQATSPTRSAKP